VLLPGNTGIPAPEGRAAVAGGTVVELPRTIPEEDAMKRKVGHERKGKGGIAASAADALRRGWATVRATFETLARSDTDALVMLEAQHRQVDRLMARIEASSRRGGRRTNTLVGELAEALELHAAIEEQNFYPGVTTTRTESLIGESLEEHAKMKRALAQLVSAAASGQGVDRQLRVLRELVTHHAKDEEEAKLFPIVREMMDAEHREALGQEMLATMVDLQRTARRRAPMRGHPAPA
jgi:hemerythrin superfamily protein